MIRPLGIVTTVIVDVFNKMAQAQLDLHNMTSQVTQEQMDLRNQLELHTTDLLTKPLSDDSPVFFLDNKESTSNFAQ